MKREELKSSRGVPETQDHVLEQQVLEDPQRMWLAASSHGLSSVAS